MDQLRGWKLATVRGVPIYLHVSLLFLLIYVIFIASVQFRFVARASGVNLAALSGTPLSWSVLFAVSLLLSVLLHEFGHIVVAQALGARVRGITLLMLGGASQMERMPEARYSEFKISVVGPLVSFAIAGILFVVERNAQSANLVLFSYWLSRVNLFLGIFNLIPAFPLDGGRVLRSVLAARQGKLRGTRNAVQASKTFAWIFGVVAVLQFNLLLLFIAFFIYAGAKAELATLTGQMLLRGVPAGTVGRRLEPILAQLSLEGAARAMVRNQSLVLPVVTVEGGLGVISAERMKRIPRKYWANVPASAVMSSGVEAIDVDAPLDHVLERGSFISAGGIPLLERGAVVGILRSSDVAESIELRYLQMDLSEEQLPEERSVA